MADIMKKVDLENDLSIYIVIGKATSEELAAKVHEFYKDAITSNTLWDFTQSDLRGIRAADVDSIAKLSVAYAGERPSGKTAVVGSEELTFGLLRMYEIIKENSELPFVTRAFRSIDEAYNWLAEDKKSERAD